MAHKWTAKDIVSQQGKFAVVTGGTDGIGLETARELAKAGARVIIAADREDKGQHARQNILEGASRGQVEFERLDTSDLDSVRQFASRLIEQGEAIDILVNNAGIVGVNPRKTSAQGFELHLATNYLGHFALTGLILPLLIKSAAPRVISVSSLEHKKAKIDFNDLQLEQNYDADTAYAQSKLAMLLFGLELQRRSDASGFHLMSIPVHPGGVDTNLFDRGDEISDEKKSLRQRALEQFVETFGQTAQQGALPTLFAATSPEALGGHYYGPSHLGEFRGYPEEADIASQAQDQEVASRLWSVSEELTSVRYDWTSEDRLTQPRGEQASTNHPLQSRT